MKFLRLSLVLAASCLVWAAPGRAADTTPPTVLSVSPPPGATISNLTQVTVTFSEAVTGVESEDFLINGNSASGRTGGSTVWTFTFTQPLAGLVAFTWDASHAIYDLAGNRFDELGAGARWSYTLVDTIAPTVSTTTPRPGAVVAALTQIEITFKEPVTGVNAADLMINGQAASTVTGADAGPYLFTFAQPANGVVSIAWAGGHGIQDTAPAPNAFAGGSWNYTLNTAFTADIVLNEIMADNLNGLVDEDGDTSDWIELFNRGTNNVSLLGWSLTDDPTLPGQWVFPAVTLNAGQYLLVFASGKDRATTGPLTNHTSFTLALSEYLGLYNAQLPRQVVNEFAPAFPDQRSDISWGRTTTNTYVYFATATPRAANSSATNYSGFVLLPHASVSSGLFNQPFNLALTCETPGASIYYTLNGEVPTVASGTLYTGLIPIAGTTNKAVIPVRAAAFKTGLLPSTTLTRTYIFPDQVPFQPFRPAGFPTNWVSEYPGATADTIADYEMDPQVLTNGTNLQIVRQALREIPTVSLVTSIDTLFAPTNGVYSGRRKQGNQRPVNVEMMLPDGSPVFQVDCGFEVQGGSSPTDASGDWKDKKLSMRLIFKGDFGTPKLHAKVFDDTPIEEFDTLILDAGLNWWWTHMTDATQRESAKFITDTVTCDFMNNAGMVAQHTRFVHLYVDGLYWGLYWLHERMDEAAAASYLGGQKEEWDVFKHTGDAAGLQNGTITNYQAMLTLARSGLANNSTYEQFQTVVDMPWFCDYMIVNLWVGNTDWANHNWYAWHRTRSPNPLPWRFVSWDAEHTFEGVGDNRVGVADANSPGEVFQLLRANAEFRILFGDHVHKMMFNRGPLYTVMDRTAFWSPTNTTDNTPANTYRKRVDEIWNSIVCESARWGDVATVVANNPYTRDLNYARELNAMYSITNFGRSPNYFPLRGSNVLAQFRSASLYPSVAAPVFSQFGGRVAAGYPLYMTNAAGSGTIYFTTNGTDPRVYGSGAVSAQAVAYTGVPFALNQSLPVQARTVVNGTNWSALNAAVFTVGALGVPLRITEIMYHPPGGDAHEFIELLNTGPDELNLSGYSFEGIAFAFAPGYTLAAGARIVLASDASPAAFAAQYPGVAVAGYFGGALANGGERIAIKDALGRTVISVDYNDGNGWPTAADGGGYSLEIIDPNGNPDDPANWRASPVVKGTPGQPPVFGGTSIVINEVMAENLTTTNNGGTYPDWVELHNSAPLDLTGWSLSDNGNPRRFVFTNGPILAADSYPVIWFDTNNAAPGLHTGFALDKDGGSVFLYDPNTNRIDGITFGRQLADFTLGRISGNWRLNQPTPGAPNALPPGGIGADTNLVINEWLANAPPGGSDWIELYNRSATQPVSLAGIYLATSNALFRAAAYSFLEPGGFIQLFADELPGAVHVDFKLPSTGGAIILYDDTGLEINRVTYGVQAQGVSQGRLPDGTAAIVSFVGSASPAAANYLATYAGPALNEVMARNVSGSLAPWGRYADWIEIANSNGAPADLSGLSLSDSAFVRRWVFPAGTTLGGNSYLRIWCDGAQPASTASGADMNTGFSLNGDSGGVYLFNVQGQLVNFVEYGFQVADLSIGLSAGQWRLLSSPTPGAANAAPAALGSTANLKINEWMADPDAGNDWFELFNADAAPVNLAGLYLTDSPSITGLTEYQIAPLSFIGARGFVKWEADDDPGQGRNHVSFNLDELGETLRLYTAGLVLIDAVDFGLQQHGVSQGRFVDGSSTLVSFPTTSTPGESNYLPLPNAIINEVLTHTDPPLEDAIELFNPTPAAAPIGGWFLSNSRDDLKKYRITNGASIPAGGYLVIYETNFNGAGATTPFTLNSAHGDEVWLSQADGAGNLSGYRTTVRFGAAANGVSFGRFSTSLGVEFTALSNRTFGADSPASVEQFRTGTGAANGYARVGPVVINELMYHPPDIGGTNDDTIDEFIELKNIAATSVSLFDTNYATNHWRLQYGVSFTFPAGVTLAPGEQVLVVNFDPALDPAQLAAFRSRYGVSTNVAIFGPYGGKLDNGGENIELVRPDTPQPADGFVPYILVDRVNFTDQSPWPSAADGNTNGIGASLQRRVASNYGNEPLNWQAGAPTPGAPTGAPLLTLPAITLQPQNTGGAVGASVSFSVTASGGAPLAYQWRLNGVPLNPILSATNSTLSIVGLQTTDEGTYTVFVSNPAGSVLSDPATLTVQAAPTITQQPQTQAAAVGANVTFTVVASGGGLTYQWRFNGTNLVGQTNATLTRSNVQNADAGPYTVLVANTFNTTPSAIAYLVLTPPDLTSQPQSRTVSVGSNVTFSVTATGDAPLSYQWRRNGANLATGTNATLLVPNAQNADGGNYTVVVFNPSGSVTSAVATLNFFLQITQQPVSASVNPSNNVTFSVTAIGTGTLRYQWKFNTIDLTDKTNSTLPLTNVQLANNGDYTVLVTDDIGSVTSQPATLTVLVAPKLGINPVSQTVAAGTPVTFLTSAYGTLPLSFRWRKAPPGGAVANLTNIIINQTNCFFTMASVTNSDAGTYTVTATNVAGASVSPSLTTNCFLTVVVPPVSQTVAPGSNVTFSARVSGPNGTSIPVAYQWRFYGTNLPGATSTNLTVPNVQAENTGPYTFVVTNGYGTPTGFPVTLALIPPPQLSQPQVLGDGSFQLLFSGFSNRSYFIEISTNLLDWTNATTLNYSNGLMPWVDVTTTNVPYRFYRGRLVP